MIWKVFWSVEKTSLFGILHLLRYGTYGIMNCVFLVKEPNVTSDKDKQILKCEWKSASKNQICPGAQRCVQTLSKFHRLCLNDVLFLQNLVPKVCSKSQGLKVIHFSLIFWEEKLSKGFDFATISLYSVFPHYVSK